MAASNVRNDHHRHLYQVIRNTNKNLKNSPHQGATVLSGEPRGWQVAAVVASCAQPKPIHHSKYFNSSALVALREHSLKYE